MTAPELTAAQAARAAAIDAAPAAEEALVERMARAIAQTGYESVIDADMWEYAFREDQREDFREYAAAALAVVRGEVQ